MPSDHSTLQTTPASAAARRSYDLLTYCLVQRLTQEQTAESLRLAVRSARRGWWSSLRRRGVLRRVEMWLRCVPTTPLPWPMRPRWMWLLTSVSPAPASVKRCLRPDRWVTPALTAWPTDRVRFRRAGPYDPCCAGYGQGSVSSLGDNDDFAHFCRQVVLTRSFPDLVDRVVGTDQEANHCPRGEDRHRDWWRIDSQEGRGKHYEQQRLYRHRGGGRLGADERRCHTGNQRQQHKSAR